MSDLPANPALAPSRKKPLSSAAVPLICILFALSMAVFSTGFLEADEITHYLYARAIWHDPYALVSIWGRLGCSALYGLAAPAGFTAARLLAVGVTILTAHGTAQLLRHISRLPGMQPPSWIARHATAFAWLLFFAQPCVLLNSFTVMTEMLLACAWVWAAVVLVKFPTRAGLLCGGFILGIGGIMRPEGWIAIAAWPLWATAWRYLHARTLRKQWSAIGLSSFLAGLWPLGWFLLGVKVWGRWDWLKLAWPTNWQTDSPYGKTAGLFLLSSLAALAFWMWIPAFAAMRRLWKARSQQALLLLVCPVAGFFLMHGLLGSFGLFGSLSLPRYFQAVAPLIAVLAVLGVGRLSSTPRGLAWIVPLSLLPVAVLGALRLLPMQAVTEQRKLDVVIDAVRARGAVHEQLLIRHPYPLMRLGLDLKSPAQVRVLNPVEIQKAPPGTLLIVDSTVWIYEGCPKPDDLARWGYIIDQASAAQVDKIPTRFEPLTFLVDRDARVRLWIKSTSE